jgi:hypothetical protein
MSDASAGDEVYQPTGDNEEQADAAPLDMEDALGEDDYDESLDRGYSPPERPYGVEAGGTTGEEQREGQSLDDRLAEEVPDVSEAPGDGVGDTSDAEGEPVDPEAGGARAGRLVADGQGAGRTSGDPASARDVGVDGGAAGAEEAAVHLVDDPEQPPDGRD